MLLKRPKEYELIIDTAGDYITTLTAFGLAALKNQPTTIKRVERTSLVAAMEAFLASGGIACHWSERAVTIDPSGRRPFEFAQPVSDYELFKVMMTLAATMEGSSISLIDDIDDTIQMIVLALRRMGAEVEFVGGREPRMLVRQAVNREIKYHLKRENSKIVPQLVTAMAAIGKTSELFDLFAASRFDYLFAHFLPGFRRMSLAEAEPEDELERRLRKRTPQVSEYLSRITITGGVDDAASTLTLRPDCEFAAYLIAAVINHGKGKLILRDYRAEDINDSPLGQLKRMGVEFVPVNDGNLRGYRVGRSRLKARKVAYEQLHDFPDAIGALALAGSASDGTSVIRSSPYNTHREEERQRRIAELIKSLGVKIAEIGDGFVLEGRRELSSEGVRTENDPICALLAVAAPLGTVDQLEVDDVSAGVARWGGAFEKVLKLFPAGG
jgi:5-enolpyruvylshikimate-3-phosphate synthase